MIAEDKEITATLVWRRRGSGYRLQDAVVLARESGTRLGLRGYVGRTNRGFSLLHKNTPIRKYTAHARHPNPDGTKIEGPHKHTWDTIFEDHIAYIPTDIRFGDANDELVDFLAECNVTLISTYQRQAFPFQLTWG